MRATAICLLALLPLPAQEPVTFRANSRLVEVSVVATARDGSPVAGLEPSDFTITDGGRRREIAVFRFEGATQPPPSAPAPAPEPFVFTNRQPIPGSPPRSVTALLLDATNTTPADQMFVKAQTLRLLEAIEPNSLIALYQLAPALSAVHDFTDDRDQLRILLRQVRIEFQSQRLSDVERAAREAEEVLAQIAATKSQYRLPVFRAAGAAARASIAGEVNFNSTVRGNRVESTLAALEALGRHLHDIPGRKSLVWITGGISLFLARVSTSPNGIPANPMSGDSLERAIRVTARRLAQSGVSLYILDARGLTSSAENLSERQELPPLAGRYSELERAAALSSDPRAASSLLASVTGGRFVSGVNDLSLGARLLSSDLRASYTLGFYLPEEPDGKWHPLKVTVRRPGVELLFKQGYLSEAAPPPPAWDAEAQRRALLNPLGASDIRFTARCQPAPGAPPGALQLILHIDAADLAWQPASGRESAAVEIFLGEKLPDGGIRFQQSKIQAALAPAQRELARQHGLPFRHQWQPDDGARSLRILVRDSNTGRVGTLDIPSSALKPR